MKRQTGHPGMEALANFRAGLVEGVHGRQIAAHIACCERCAQLSDQLSTVTQALASIPAPSLPDAVEQRIGAAIAAEAAARRVASLAASSVADPSAAASPAPVSPAPVSPAAERWHARRWSPRRALKSVGPRLRLSPVQMLVPVAACLLLAGLGYLLSMPKAAGMPSSAGSSSALRSATAPGKSPVSGGPRRDAISPTSATGSMPGGHRPVFLVTVSTIRYQKSTLRAQINSQLARQALTPDVSPSPVITGTTGNQKGASGSAGPPNSAFVPSTSLVGCVMHLTEDVQPDLVQRATYQAEPVYVIAIQDRAWVVGLTCTAAKPALIISVALAPVG
jgi:hypothetical protein